MGILFNRHSLSSSNFCHSEGSEESSLVSRDSSRRLCLQKRRVSVPENQDDRLQLCPEIIVPKCVKICFSPRKWGLAVTTNSVLVYESLTIAFQSPKIRISGYNSLRSAVIFWRYTTKAINLGIRDKYRRSEKDFHFLTWKEVMAVRNMIINNIAPNMSTL